MCAKLIKKDGASTNFLDYKRSAKAHEAISFLVIKNRYSVPKYTYSTLRLNLGFIIKTFTSAGNLA